MVLFYEAYSSPEFAELVQGLSLPQIVQTTSAQLNEIVQPETAQLPNWPIIQKQLQNSKTEHSSIS